MRLFETVTVVIRSAHERTEQLCRSLILEQGVPAGQVHVIHEKPFSRAMITAYTLGVDCNRTWTLCIDADLLLRPGSIEALLRVANASPDDVMVLSGQVLDKLFGDVRRAGNHLFRTSCLPLMLRQVASYKDENIRPESTIIKYWMNRGYTWKFLDETVGLHDFEQHYHDISRKCFVHARKHTEYLGDLAGFWLPRAAEDPDYRAALLGLSRGVFYNGEVRINVDDFHSLQEETIREIGRRGEGPESFNIRTGREVMAIIENPKQFLKPEPAENFRKRDDLIYRDRFKKDRYGNIRSMMFKKVARDIKSLFRFLK